MRTTLWLAPAALLALLVADERMRGLLVRSWALCLQSAIISLIVGGVLAWLLYRVRLPGRSFMQAAVIALLVLPPVIAASAWEAGWGRLGWYTLLQGQVEQPWLRGWRATVWVHGMLGTPWVVLFLGPALRAAAAWEEPARSEAPWFRVFWRITLPAVAPYLGAALVWISAMTFAEMTVADIYAVRTFAEEIYVGYALGDEAPLTWLQVAAPGMLTVLWLLSAAAWAATLGFPEAAYTPASADWTPGRWRWPLTALALAGVLLLCGAPLTNLVLKAGTAPGVAGAWSLTQLGARCWTCSKDTARSFSGH